VKNIYLIQVVDSYGPNKFLPLAIAYQWLNAKNSNWQLKDTLIEKLNIKKYVNSMENPSVVAMSCYVWNWNYNCELAKEIKSKWPECLIVIGGPQVSKTDFLLLKKHPYFDIAILGENEEAFKTILESYDSKNFESIPGTMIPGKIIPGIKRTQNLNELPSPILTGFYNDIIDKYQSNGNSYMWQVTYETMRGCPYHCAFCDIGEDYWNKTFQFDINRVYAEIDWMAENKIEYVAVCDSNWGLFERDYDITAYVIKKKLETGYPKFWDVTWAKSNHDRVRRIAELDKAAGTRLFKGVTFAVQSLNKETLNSVERFNLSESVIKTSMNYFKAKDIPTYSELIWPMPGETTDTLINGMQKLIDLGQEDFVMVHPLVLTPNAPMGQPDYVKKHKLQFKEVPLDTFWLKVEDPDNYVVETVYAVHSTEHVSKEQTVQGHLFAHWLIVMYYYGWAHFIMKYLKNKLSITETDFIKDLIRYIELKKQGLLYDEHIETQKSLLNVFNNSGFWGRLVDGIYWEYKSATCVKFHFQRTLLKEELSRFIEYQYNIKDSDLIDLNADMCFDWRKEYPINKQLSKELTSLCFGTDIEDFNIYHDDTSLKDDSEFIKKVYHYQRKNRYWKCSIKVVE
jgi:radical SAM superfamily enzyme YgiQ (UPF0313 family)